MGVRLQAESRKETEANGRIGGGEWWGVVGRVGLSTRVYSYCKKPLTVNYYLSSVMVPQLEGRWTLGRKVLSSIPAVNAAFVTGRVSEFMLSRRSRG